MKKCLTALLLISCASVVWGKPRNPLPKTPDQIWQNDLDLQQAIDNAGDNAINSSSGTIAVFSCTTCTIQNINGTFIGLGRNRIINGDMRIDQRNVGSTITLDGFPVDRFGGSEGSDGAVQSQQLATGGPANFTNFMRSSCTVADTSIAAGQYMDLYQAIEGNNSRDFLFGTSAAKSITISFWVRSSSAGIYAVALQNSAADRSYVSEYTISAVNAWEKKAITVTGDTTGTWLTDNGIGVSVIWSLTVGSARQTSAGTWAAGAFIGTSRQNNWLSSNSARTFDITGVQLEIGTVATEFEYRPITLEMAFCQRYFWKTLQQTAQVKDLPNTVRNAISYRASVTGVTGVASVHVRFPVTMRVTPTITAFDPVATGSKWRNETDGADSGTAVIDTNFAGDSGFDIRNDPILTDTLGDLIDIHATANSEL